MKEIDTGVLSDVCLFRGINPEDCKELLQCMGAYRQEYQKSEYIIFDGEKLESIGVVLRGQVQMIKEDYWGGKSLIAVNNPGDIFGESIVCGGVSGSIVSYQVGESCEILFIPFKNVLHPCGSQCPRHQYLVDNMVSVIAKKNVQLLETLEVLSKKRIRERILTYLSQRMQKNHEPVVRSELGRTDMADYLCVDRSALTRELVNMQREGLLEFEKNTFVLKDASKYIKG